MKSASPKLSPPPKLPQPLIIEARRWTAQFIILPFAVCIGLSGIYYAVGLKMMLGGDIGLATSALVGFASLCIAITLGNSSLKSIRAKGPSLILDEDGLTDLRQEIGLIPWAQMASVGFDSEDTRILIKLNSESYLNPNGKSIKARAMRFWRGGDIVVVLSGLSYNHPELETTMWAFHAQALAELTNRRTFVQQV